MDPISGSNEAQGGKPAHGSALLAMRLSIAGFSSPFLFGLSSMAEHQSGVYCRRVAQTNSRAFVLLKARENAVRSRFSKGCRPTEAVITIDR